MSKNKQNENRNSVGVAAAGCLCAVVFFSEVKRQLSWQPYAAERIGRRFTSAKYESRAILTQVVVTSFPSLVFLPNEYRSASTRTGFCGVFATLCWCVALGILYLGFIGILRCAGISKRTLCYSLTQSQSNSNLISSV